MGSPTQYNAATHPKVGEKTAKATSNASLIGPTARKLPFALLDQAFVSSANFLSTVFIGRAGGLDELGAYALGFTALVLINTAVESLAMAPYTVGSSPEFVGE